MIGKSLLALKDLYLVYKGLLAIQIAKCNCKKIKFCTSTIVVVFSHLLVKRIVDVSGKCALSITARNVYCGADAILIRGSVTKTRAQT